MEKVLTGIRPTGKLHLGHFAGALQQWLPLQQTHECFFLMADVQALTTHIGKPALIEESVRDVLLDWLSVGLDPFRANVHLVLQSHVRELFELTELLSMVTPHSWILSNPTIKTELQKLKGLISSGFMHYIVSQAGDIGFVSPDPRVDSSPILVPVGDDQEAHLRDYNRIVARFNELYGPTFVPCKGLYATMGRLVGIEGGEKMSKSAGNSIYLSEPVASLRKKVNSMYTDPKRIHADTPGTVEGNPVFIYLDAFARNLSEVEELKRRYRAGTVRDVEVKDYLFQVLNSFLTPIRERREAAERTNLYNVLMDGTAKAQVLASETIQRVEAAMHLDYKTLRR